MSELKKKFGLRLQFDFMKLFQVVGPFAMYIFYGSATALTEGVSLMTLEWRTYIAFQVWESELGIPT